MERPRPNVYASLVTVWTFLYLLFFVFEISSFSLTILACSLTRSLALHNDVSSSWFSFSRDEIVSSSCSDCKEYVPLCNKGYTIKLIKSLRIPILQNNMHLTLLCWSNKIFSSPFRLSYQELFSSDHSLCISELQSFGKSQILLLIFSMRLLISM